MGLSSKHFSGDQGLDWGNTFRLREAAEMSIRRQQPQPQQSEMLKCPRCSSTNTKFCYYNNYNKSQPRHFCKSCKRHWTKGGTLRNVPVGGGRKNKRPKVSKPAAATARVPASRQDFPSIPLSSGEKNASSILYQSMIGRSSVEDSSVSEPFVGNSAGLSAAAAHQSIPYTEFQLSSLSTFDMNASLNPSSFQPLSVFDHFGGNIDSVEESTITTVNVPGSSGAAPWGGESSSTLDLPSYWNWNEIDVLTLGDLSISWDDQDNGVMKP